MKLHNIWWILWKNKHCSSLLQLHLSLAHTFFLFAFLKIFGVCPLEVAEEDNTFLTQPASPVDGGYIWSKTSWGNTKSLKPKSGWSCFLLLYAI